MTDANRKRGLGVRTVGHDDLTPMERKFVEAYLGDANCNVERAARMAGYCPGGTPTTRAREGAGILKRPRVAAFIESAMENDPLVMGRQERLRLMTSIARGEIKDKILTIPGEDGGTVERVAATADRLKALEQLAKAAGEGTKIEISVQADKMSNDELLAALTVVGVTPEMLFAGAPPLLTADVIDTDGEEDPEP
jgi:phage terminase small subunit